VALNSFWYSFFCCLPKEAAEKGIPKGVQSHAEGSAEI